MHISLQMRTRQDKLVPSLPNLAMKCLAALAASEITEVVTDY